MLTKTEGVTRLPKNQGWHLHQNFSGFKVPRSKTERFLHKFYGDFSLSVSGSFLETSRGSLLTVSHPHRFLPFLDLQIDLVENKMTLRYLGVSSFQRVELRDVFPSSSWTRVQVDLLGRTLLVHVDCMSGVKTTLKQAMGEIPSEAVMYVGNRAGSSNVQVIFYVEIENDIITDTVFRLERQNFRSKD